MNATTTATKSDRYFKQLLASHQGWKNTGDTYQLRTAGEQEYLEIFRSSEGKGWVVCLRYLVTVDGKASPNTRYGHYYPSFKQLLASRSRWR